MCPSCTVTAGSTSWPEAPIHGQACANAAPQHWPVRGPPWCGCEGGEGGTCSPLHAPHTSGPTLTPNMGLHASSQVAALLPSCGSERGTCCDAAPSFSEKLDAPRRPVVSKGPGGRRAPGPNPMSGTLGIAGRRHLRAPVMPGIEERK